MPIQKKVTLTGEVQVSLDEFSQGEKEAWALNNGWVKPGIVQPTDPPPVNNNQGYSVWLPGSPTSVDFLERGASMVKQSPIDIIVSQCWQGDMSHCIMSSRYKFNAKNVARDLKRIRSATGKKAAFVATTTDVSDSFEFLENDNHYNQMANGLIEAAEMSMSEGDDVLYFDNEIYRYPDSRWANYWGEQRVSPLKAYERGLNLGKRLPKGLAFYFNHGIEKAFMPTDAQILHAGARGNYPQENRNLGHFLAGLINGGFSVGARVIECAQLYGLRGNEFTRLKNWVKQMQERDSLNPSGDNLNHWKSLPLTFMAYTNDWPEAVRIGRDMDPKTYQQLLKDINAQKDPNTHTVIYGEWFTGDKQERFNAFWNPAGDWQKAIKGQL
jgi:hypothetical protein